MQLWGNLGWTGRYTPNPMSPEPGTVTASDWEEQTAGQLHVSQTGNVLGTFALGICEHERHPCRSAFLLGEALRVPLIF